MSDSGQVLHQASEALASAFSRLEASVEHILNTPKADGDIKALEESFRKQLEALQDENIHLREENVTLHRELQDSQEAYQDLQERTERVAAKIEKKAQQLELMA